MALALVISAEVEAISILATPEASPGTSLMEVTPGSCSRDFLIFLEQAAQLTPAISPL